MIEPIKDLWHTHGTDSVWNLVKLLGAEHGVDAVIEIPTLLLKAIESELSYTKGLFWLRVMSAAFTMFVFFSDRMSSALSLAALFVFVTLGWIFLHN